jgi:carboxymethylenebutenolidase
MRTGMLAGTARGAWNGVSRRRLLQVLLGLGGAGAASCFFGPTVFAGAREPAQSGDAVNPSVRTIHYASGDAQIEAYLAVPGSGGKHPGVLVIHDDTGLRKHTRALARRLATQGFVAIAPDLLSRSGGIEKVVPQEIATTIKGLSVEGTVQDLQKGYTFLRNSPDVDPQSISSIGFGWGGWRNFLLAGAVDDLRRLVVFSAGTPSDGLGDVQAPVLAHYAQFDFRVTGNALWTAKTMQDLGKRFAYYIYPHVYRDFFNETSAEYNAEAAAMAWTRTLEFLRSPV